MENMLAKHPSAAKNSSSENPPELLNPSQDADGSTRASASPDNPVLQRIGLGKSLGGARIRSFQRTRKPQHNFPGHVEKQSFCKSLLWVHILIYTLLLLLYMLFSIGDEIHMSACPLILSTLLSEALIYFLAF